jgi:hypothetical protein
MDDDEPRVKLLGEIDMDRAVRVLDVTREELAERLGVDPVALRRWYDSTSRESPPHATGGQGEAPPWLAKAQRWCLALGIGALALAAILWLAGCLEGRSDRPLGSTCSGDTECAGDLVCSYGRCRAQCSFDRDCPEGTVCVQGEGGGSGVCTLAEEEGCEATSCAPGWVCVGGECVRVVGGDGDGDIDVDADSDSDSDTDSDTDGDTDADADVDADGDSDADLDADADVETDTDADEVCIGEGDEGGTLPESPTCCPGLGPISCAEYFGGMCSHATDCIRCTYCGNDICGLGENQCNCVEDCPAEGCVAEGDTFPVSPSHPDCCAGLVPVGCDTIAWDGSCALCAGVSYCARCGDGFCGLAENRCRCPDDCS